MLASLQQKFFHLPLWAWITLGAFIAGGLVAVAVNQPVHAGWRFGACRAILEDTVRFPQTIKIILGGETASSATIAYSDINAYGSQQVKVFECYYSTSKSGRPVLSKITQDRRLFSDAQVAKYNAQLPIILTQELNTELPKDFPRSLEDYRQ